MDANRIGDQILQSVDMLIQNRLGKADFDKTILATVISCEDPVLGKYKIKYQDGYWFAFSSSPDVKFSDGAQVYITIPSGNMNNTKIILGTVDSKDKGTYSYLTIKKQQDIIVPIGQNEIEDSGEHSLCSYHTDTLVLYDKNSNNNIIGIKTDFIDEYLKKSSLLYVGMTVKTNLPIQQRYNGNYGIKYYLTFQDNQTNNEIIRQYIFDVDLMEGNPYSFKSPVKQTTIFTGDLKNLIQINKIELFVEKFPNQDQQYHENDIFISNLFLMGAESLSGQDLNTYSLYFTTPKGFIFTEQDLATDERNVIANVMVKGDRVNNSSQDIEYYWFVQNTSITIDHPFYSKIGGQGWRCLNLYQVIQSEKVIQDEQEVEKIKSVKYLPGQQEWIVKKQDIKGKKVKYKCVAIYNRNTLEREITFQNNDYQYNLVIQSTNGTEFYYDNGQTQLIAKLYDKLNNQITQGINWVWIKKNYKGVVQNITQDQNTIQAYHAALNNYQTLKEQLQSQELNYYDYNIDFPTQTNLQRLRELEWQIQQYQDLIGIIIQDNVVSGIKIKNINKVQTYLLSVFDILSGQLLASGQISLINNLNNDTSYSLVIENGSQVFKYNTYGISPVEAAEGQPYIIKPLSFNVYDPNGNLIQRNVIRHSQIQWKVPVVNTMLTFEEYQGDYTNDGKYKIIKGEGNAALLSLTYGIKSKYSVLDNQNTVQLKIKYKDNILIAKTDFSFIKQGDNGTNGTEYVVRIIKNLSQGDYNNLDYQMPIAWYNLSDNTYESIIPQSEDQLYSPFNIEFWHNGEVIFTGNKSGTTQENKTIQIEWKILKNVYKVTEQSGTIRRVSEPTDLKITQDINPVTGNFNSKGCKDIVAELNGQTPYSTNIIEAIIKYDGLIYYATKPILTAARTNNYYRIGLKWNTGFREVVYDNDGTKPIYDNSVPFEVVVYKKMNSQTWEDISLRQSKFVPYYQWYFIGSVYNTVRTRWDNEVYLQTDDSGNQLPKNQKRLKVTEGYDGLCLNQALVCKVDIYDQAIDEQSQEEIAPLTSLYLHIPIHLMLNRYGISSLNNWDGNGIELNEQGGYILAPQVGAGVKHADNTFTGVLIGKKRTPSQNGQATKDSQVFDNVREDEQIGLFGFSKGQQSIFLDAGTGKAEFGVSSSGKIIIDPTQVDESGRGAAVIRSSSYRRASQGITGAGMAINFSDATYDGQEGPWIRYGNGKFSVNKEGVLNASNGIFSGSVTAIQGSIGNWLIDDGAITSPDGNLQLSADGTIVSGDISGSAGYILDSDGTITAVGVDISGEINASTGSIGGWTINPANIQSNSQMTTLGSNGSITVTNSNNINTFVIDSTGNVTISPQNFILSNNDGSTPQNIATALENAGISTKEEVFDIITDYGDNQGIFLLPKKPDQSFDYDGLYINANYIKTGTFSVSKSQQGGQLPTVVFEANVTNGTVSITPDIFKLETNSLDSYIKLGSSTNNGVTEWNFEVDGRGLLKAKGATINGSITATSGKIGNWTVVPSTYALYPGGLKSNDDMIIFDPNSGIYLNYTEEDQNTQQSGFKVTNAGQLYCSSVDLKGEITATSGKIGNWIITSTTAQTDAGILKSNDNKIKFDPNNGIYLNYNSTQQTGFRVTNAGVLQCSSANLTGGSITISNEGVQIFKVTSTGTTTMKDAHLSGNFTIDNYGGNNYRNSSYINSTGGFALGIGAIDSMAIQSNIQQPTGDALTAGECYFGSNLLWFTHSNSKIVCTNIEVNKITIKTNNLKNVSYLATNANGQIIAGTAPSGGGGSDPHFNGDNLTTSGSVTFSGLSGTGSYIGINNNGVLSKVSGPSFPSTVSNQVTFSNDIYMTGVRDDEVGTSTYPIGVGTSTGKVWKNPSSSMRYKDILRKMDIIDIQDVFKIQPVIAKYKEGYLSIKDERVDKYMPMFIAENIEKYIPIAANHNENGEVEDWNTKIIVPVMFQMIKYLKEEIDELKIINKSR